MSDARRADVDEWVARQLADAPPLTDEQRRTVARLLVTDATTEGDRWTVTGTLDDGTRVRLHGEPGG